ncbi:MAG: SDR family oxidoreductase [Bacteroidota bacterium]
MLQKGPYNRLKNQIALVTGANSGIGKAVALELAREGATVIVNWVFNEEAADEVVAQIKEEGGKGMHIKADVSNEDEVISMFESLISSYGRLDILVNNAGLQRDAAFWEMSLQQWQKVIDVNLTGQFLCAREAVKLFMKQGIDENISCSAGKIVCMSSVHEVIPWAGHANYAASKGGVMLLMQSLAQEVAPHKIRVNSIGPGAIKTPINTAAWSTPAAEAKLLELIPYNRVGNPIDIAKAAVWLASDESEYVQGITLFVDGGMTLYPGFATGG